MAGLQRFRYIDAAFIIGSIITFILDQATGERKEIVVILFSADVQVRNLKFPEHTLSLPSLPP